MDWQHHPNTKAMTEEMEALRKDAMRYRFLRDSQNAYPLFFIAQRDPHNVVVQFTGELADMNIDELIGPNALAQGPGGSLPGPAGATS